MKEYVKGNYKLDAVIEEKGSEDGSETTAEFEKKALSRLGGSICFVSTKGFFWKGERSDGAGA